MVEWMNPEVLALTAFVYAQVTIFMLGVYLWYFILSLKEVEGGLLARRIKFQLAHVPYLIGRYSHLMALVGIAIATHTKTSLSDCSALAFERFLAITEQLALAAASSNLALRAMVIWNDSRAVKYTLWAICAGHFLYAFVLGIAAVTKQWNPATQMCAVVSYPDPLIGFFFLTLVWDVTIMALTILGMRKLGANTKLSFTVIVQGIGYAMLTLLTCIPMTVLFILQLNPIMDIFLIPVGCTFSVIASSAAVTSLPKLNGVESRGSDFRTSGNPDTFNNSKPPNPLTTIIDLPGTSTTSRYGDLHDSESASFRHSKSDGLGL